MGAMISRTLRALALAAPLTLAGCQSQGELPACTSHCVVILVEAAQTRGGNSPTTEATIPLVP